MKKYALALSALMMLSGVAMAADAAAAAATTTTTTTTTAATPKAKTVKAHKAVAPAEMKTRGEVVSVDAVANTLTIKGKKENATFAISATAKIMSGKKEVKLADITAGEHASVTYTKDGATMTASAVKVMPAKAAKAAKKAPAPAAASKK